MSEDFIKITGSLIISNIIIFTAYSMTHTSSNDFVLILGFILGQMISVVFVSALVTLVPLILKKDCKAGVFSVTCIIISFMSTLGQIYSNHYDDRSSITLKTPDAEIISPLMAKVEGKAKIDGNTFKGSIYNGSDKYLIKEIIITINHKNGTSRDYKINHFPPIAQKLASSKNYFADEPLPTLSGIKYSIPPLDSGSFSITTFDTTSKNYDSWYIESVKVEVK